MLGDGAVIRKFPRCEDFRKAQTCHLEKATDRTFVRGLWNDTVIVRVHRRSHPFGILKRSFERRGAGRAFHKECSCGICKLRRAFRSFLQTCTLRGQAKGEGVEIENMPKMEHATPYFTLGLNLNIRNLQIKDSIISKPALQCLERANRIGHVLQHMGEADEVE